MYAWKCWHESRSRFIFLLMMFTAFALLATLMPGFSEQNGWWHFDRSEYIHNPWPTAHLVFFMVLSGLWCSGFHRRCSSAQLLPVAKSNRERLNTCGRDRRRGLR